MRSGGKAIAILTGVLLAAGAVAAPATAAAARPAGASAAISAPPPGPVEPSGAPTDVVTGLHVPWSILQFHDAAGTVLISERNTGVIERLTSTGGLDPVGTVPGVAHTAGGENGLLGLATLVDGGTRWIYAYLSTATDNRIVRMVYTDPGDPADATLGAPQVLLSGLQVAKSHDGGRIAFGPDGMLYATVGDTRRLTLPQDVHALNGKILRMTPTGGVPADNPFPGSLVYSLGHRNPQGLAWDADGDLWSSELGQNTWDEFNKIVPGGNYGWPVVEGISSDPRYINPWQQWPTSQASPSGLAYVDGTFFMASLRGARLWSIYVDKAAGTARSVASYVNTLGRIRDVAAAPGGTLWMLSNNTGVGAGRPGDDRIAQVALVPTARIDGTVDCATCPRANSVRIDVTVQKQVSGAWTGYQRVRVTGGTGDFAFPAVAAGTYRLLITDAGGAGYRTFTGAPFSIATSGVLHAGTIRLRGAQLDRDLSGDGINDLLAVDGAAALVEYDGVAAGGFAAPRTVAADWSDAAATAQVGDFDADGFADAVSRDSTGALFLHRGDGAGGWIESVPLAPARPAGTLLLGPGDWDGDGRADLITGDTAGRLWLWKGNGAGALGAPRQIGHGWASLTSVMPTGDLTGDQKPDLVARTAAGDLFVYPGNGVGGFGTRARIGHGWAAFTAVLSIGDVTGDSRADVVARLADGSLRVYRGLGGGRLTAGSTISGDWSAVTFAS